MNRNHSLLAVIAAMLIFPVDCGCQQRSDRPDVAGYWYGQSAANPNVVVVLWFSSEDGTIGGKAFFPAGATLRSTETLRNVVLSGTGIAFDLPTIGTHYSGQISSTEIRGGFHTPGNPFMAFAFTRTELDSLRSADAIRAANKPYDLHRMFSRDQLKADLSVLKKGILSHPRALLYHSRGQLEGYFRNAERKVEKGMSIVEFVRVVAPLIADLRCYHSQLVLPEKMRTAFVKESTSIPLDIIYVGDRAYVRRSFVNDPVIEPGSEILAINGMSAKDILRRLAACISADGMNMSSKRAQINRAFWFLYHYIDSPSDYVLALRRPSGSRRVDISVKAVPSQVVRDAMASAEQFQTAADPDKVPVSLSIRDGVGVLAVRSFLYFDLNKYREVLDSLFAELRSRRVETLVVDLRGNAGGHPALAAHLFSFFIRQATPYLKEPRNDPQYTELLNPVEPAKDGFRERVFFLSDGSCLSSTGHFLALVKYHKLGEIVGDIPGGSYTCSDEAQLWKMPNSGIQFTIARTVFTAAVQGYRTGDQVIPDHTVKPTLSDLLGNKDTVMEAVRRLIHER